MPTIQELEDMLASDDEFPSDFDEVSVNAPMDEENDFENIVFPWLNYKNVRCMQQEVNEETGETTLNQPPFILNEAALNEKTSQLSMGTRVLAIKGILSKQDIVSLKSVIKARPGDGVVLWFINFLMYKDLQSGHSFLRSCLVTDGSDGEDRVAINNTRDTNNHNFFVTTF